MLPPVTLPRLTLILGGARSGKSARAERLIAAHGLPAVYIATAQHYDDPEMIERIDQHRARRGDGWQTVEAPFALADALRAVPLGQPVLVDCLTLWLTNIMLDDTHDAAAECRALCDTLAVLSGPVICVQSEVGLGIVPENALARRFRDASGRLAQDIAAVADHVELVAAGLPLLLKGQAL